MNLCIDQGNSFSKLGVFKSAQPEITYTCRSTDCFVLYEQIFAQYPIEHIILSSVSEHDSALTAFLKSKAPLFELGPQTALTFESAYTTPETLGADRIAAVAGAWSQQPGNDILVIDAGTAITYDFIDAGGVYRGGNIAPGVHLRAKALSDYTHRLPLVELEAEIELLGKDTASAIRAGVLYGVVFEIDGYIDRLMLKYPKLLTFLTGGSAFYFENKLKNRIFADKNLVLTGLNSILRHNV